jgi:pilus assembly protein CpaC
VGDHEIMKRKPWPVAFWCANIRSLAARRRQFQRVGIAVMLAISAAHQFYGHAAAQTKNDVDTRNLDVQAMRAANAELLLHVKIVQNKTRNLKLDVPFEDVAVGSPDIADVVPISDRQLYILGKKIGTTNVLVYGPKKRLIGIVDVEVKLDTGSLGAKIREASGGKNIHVEDVDGKLVLGGSSGDSETTQRAMDVAAGLGPGGVVNALKVTTPQQVMLKVRFVEADREAARNLGIRWAFFKQNGNMAGVIGTQRPTSLVPPNPAFPSSTTFPATTATSTSNSVLDVVSGAGAAGSPFATIITQIVNSKFGSLDAVLSALEEQQVVRELAEPNLIALSGQTASFLAGGEYPVPVVSGGGGAAGTISFPQVTIMYKEFGVKLDFTPTVLSRGVISLKIKPEVSDIDYTIAVVISGTLVPGLIVRRAQTTVELRDGQTFAIAGMLQSKTQRQLDQLPWLGTVPILGALFRSSEFQQKETELVVLVTPYLIKPVPPGKQLKTPLDTSLPGNDLDLFLYGRPEVAKTPPSFVNGAGQSQSLVGAIQPGAPGAEHVAPTALPGPQGDGAIHFDPATGWFVDSPTPGGGQ